MTTDKELMRWYLRAFLVTSAFLALMLWAGTARAWEDEKYVRFYSSNWAQEIDMSAIATIESSNNPLAYNKRSGAIGLYQITPIVLKEWNIYSTKAKKERNKDYRKFIQNEFVRATGYRGLPFYMYSEFYPHTSTDLFNPHINWRIADWYMNFRIPQMLEYYKINDNIINRCACYNWGIGNVVKWHRQGAKFEKLPKETRNYILKYKRLTAERGIK